MKDSSLGGIIGVLELYRRGVILYQGSRNPLETLYVVALVHLPLALNHYKEFYYIVRSDRTGHKKPVESSSKLKISVADCHRDLI